MDIPRKDAEALMFEAICEALDIPPIKYRYHSEDYWMSDSAIQDIIDRLLLAYDRQRHE